MNVHDIPEVKKHHLCYAVPRSFKPFLATCKDPYIVRLRAILSWNLVPPPGVWNFIPIWGNVLDCWVQVDPVAGKILGIVSQEAVSDGKATKKKKNEESHAGSKPTPIEAERSQFLELIQKNPNYFGTSPESDIAALKPLKCDTSYEELKCIGLYPEENFLEAVLEVKRPNGFLGDLCSPGSYEHVRFFIDWNGDGDYVDMNDDAGVTSVNVHDIPEARQVRLCYGLGKRFKALRATCQKPYIVKLRAILSWQQVPTGPSFVPVGKYSGVLDSDRPDRQSTPSPGRRDRRPDGERLRAVDARDVVPDRRYASDRDRDSRFRGGRAVHPLHASLQLGWEPTCQRRRRLSRLLASAGEPELDDTRSGWHTGILGRDAAPPRCH